MGMGLEKKTVKQLKALCKKLLYEVVYRRDADWRGYAKCVTCFKTIEANSRHCHVGHFKHGKTKLTYYDPMNCHLQCDGCNKYRNGKGAEYGVFMIKTYGEKAVDDLLKRAADTRVWTKKLLIKQAKKLQKLLEK